MDLLLSFFFIIITLLFVHVPPSVLAIDDKYEKCSAPFRANEIQAYRFNCSLVDANTANYFLITNIGMTLVFREYFGSYASNVLVSVLGSTIQFIERYPIYAYLTEVVRNGFKLQWNANNGFCDRCRQSNGLCVLVEWECLRSLVVHL
ncbi:hypothetical protein QYF36_006867 [Acer negundo]|nr:hypothetical protein QYF36_006867 [Acer negundo]